MYLEIIETKNVLKVCKEGIPDLDQATEAWENIIRKHSEVNGSFEYENYLQNIKTYGLLIQDYYWIKGALSKLAFTVDRELVKELGKKGYRISLRTSDEYEETLSACFRKVENIITKTASKQKELEGMKAKEQQESFDSIMANLNYYWPGAAIQDDITLARFNECIKVLKRGRHKQAGHLAG